jgi:hypothetical protein
MIRDETSWVPRTVAEREAARADAAEAKAARLLARLDRVDRVNPSGVPVVEWAEDGGGAPIGAAAEARVEELEAAIRDVLARQGDDLCWAEIYTTLGPLVGMTFDPLRLPTDEFLANCRAYEASLRTGLPYEPDSARRWQAEAADHWTHGLEGAGPA